eukprot:jgi/Tetstr1/462426/TSEL_000678.t1
MDMSEHHENITKAERLDLLGDWEATRSVGKIRSHKGLKDPDESNRKLKPVSYEPRVPDRSGKLEIPLWLAVDIARIEGRPVPDTSWEVAQTMPWRPVAALPMRTYDRYYRHLGGVASSSFTTNFMGTSVRRCRVPRLVLAYLSKGRKRARELAEMDIDHSAQVARLHCADLFDLDYHHH